MPALYPLWKQAIERGDPNSDLDNDTITDGPYCVLINTGTYVFSPVHQFYSSLVGAIIGTDQRITGPTVDTTGVFDGSDLVYPGISAPAIGALVIYRRNSGPMNTWRLVYFYDGPNLPVSSSGSNVRVTWNAQGIFRL